MRINEQDWSNLIGHIAATLDEFRVPAPEKQEVIGFVQSLKGEVVERGA
jgi:hypothetical protein